MEIAELVFGGISAITSLVQLYKDARNRGQSIGPAEVDHAVEEARDTKAVQENATAIQQCIPEPILRVMLDNIEAAQTRLVQALKDPANTNADKNMEVEVACSNVCGELARIKRLNRERLPTPALESLWLSHGCS